MARMHLLHIAGSPRKELSASLDVAKHFIDCWTAVHPEASVDTINVWETPLPVFDGPALAAKYAGLTGAPLTPEQQRVWSDIGRLAARFRCADIILMSVPMWNFGIPYRLKHLIDAVSQKGILFAFGNKTFSGTLAGKTAVVIAARGVPLGGDYPEEEFDHQVAYLRTWSRMVGINDFRTITIEGTLFGSKADEAARAEARNKAARLAATL